MLLCRPLDDWSILRRQPRPLRRASCELVEHGDLAVAVDELDGQIQRPHVRERLAGHRSDYDVTTNDEAIDTRGPYVGEHRFERREVAVDVEERGDTHFVIPYLSSSTLPPPVEASRFW